MKKNLLHNRKSKKIVRWGKGLVVFITTEAKRLGWDDRIVVAVSTSEIGNDKFIKIEKLATL